MATPPPPQGAPWDSPLAEASFAFVDLEMTGLDVKKDRVIEICVERVRGGEIEGRLHTLVRPETLVIAEATTAEGTPLADDVGNTEIHGIRADELSNAPTFSEIADAVTPLLTGAIFVAHGASWDVSFIEAEFARAGKPLRVGHYLDTLNLSRRTFGLTSHSLDALREHFGLDRSRAHRADADVTALRAVWDRCIEALAPTTPRDVWGVRVAEHRAREQILAECTQAIAAGAPVNVVYRPRSRPAEVLAMMLVELVTGLDPPRVIGYQLPGRGRRELRTDRILRIEPYED